MLMDGHFNSFSKKKTTTKIKHRKQEVTHQKVEKGLNDQEIYCWQKTKPGGQEAELHRLLMRPQKCMVKKYSHVATLMEMDRPWKRLQQISFFLHQNNLILKKSLKFKEIYIIFVQFV